MGFMGFYPSSTISRMINLEIQMDLTCSTHCKKLGNVMEVENHEDRSVDGRIGHETDS
jgi:hypothetical protein